MKFAELEERIGFPAVRRNIKDKCISPMGGRKADEMAFSPDYAVVARRLQSVDEMRRIIVSGKELPLSGFHDLSPVLVAVRADGSYLSARQAFQLKQFLEAIESIRRFFQNDDDEVFPQLKKSFGSLALFPELIAAIGDVVNKFGEVKDSASPELSDIRRSMASANAGISSIMRRVISRAGEAGIVDKDTAPTVRDGRLVIPISADKKRSIPGIIQDESASGRTVYIEPAEVVEAANRLRELELAERREIVRILTALTAVVRPEIDAIIDSSAIVGEFDFIRAKALYAIEVNAQLPVIEKNPGIEWYHAVHPVLLESLRSQGREVVPMNLSLNATCRFLIISGPNAGGKSVALKTTGIVQYMAQCGVLPTIYSNSHLGIFRKIFIDIGDDQSIENDLSTYSSHLRKMKTFMADADASSLVLVDEMGSGTEPNIGGALAQAILKRLHRDSKCFGIITTHYHNLKTFAEEEEGMENGAMLYDRQQLRPLFQLETGVAGSSFALEISRNIGLPVDVVEDAKSIVGSGYVDMEKYLLEIARDRRYWANKRLSIKEKSNKIDRLLEEYESKADQLREKRSEIISEARDEAKRMLADVNAKIENTIHAIRKADAEKERTRELRKELEDYRRSVTSTDTPSKEPEILKAPVSKRKAKHADKPVAVAADALVAGDYVKMDGSVVVGRILELRGKDAEVAFGSLRTRVALNKLKKTTKPKETAATQFQSLGRTTTDESRKRQLNFKTELDVRGMRGDEAVQAVTYFIDDAVQFSAGRVRILHGTGTGALKSVIRQYLNTLPVVKEFADEDVRFGGAGITVVELS